MAHCRIGNGTSRASSQSGTRHQTHARCLNMCDDRAKMLVTMRCSHAPPCPRVLAVPDAPCKRSATATRAPHAAELGMGAAEARQPEPILRRSERPVRELLCPSAHAGQALKAMHSPLCRSLSTPSSASPVYPAPDAERMGTADLADVHMPDDVDKTVQRQVNAVTPGLFRYAARNLALACCVCINMSSACRACHMACSTASQQHFVHVQQPQFCTLACHAVHSRNKHDAAITRPAQRRLQRACMMHATLQGFWGQAQVQWPGVHCALL